jgi:hypothetical protein
MISLSDEVKLSKEQAFEKLASLHIHELRGQTPVFCWNMLVWSSVS